MASITVHGFQLRDAILHNTDLKLAVDPGAQVTTQSPYGEIYVYNNGTTQTLTLQNTYYQLVQGWAAGLANQFTADAAASRLVCNQAGNYQVSGIVSFQGPNNQTYRFSIFLNGIFQTNLTMEASGRGVATSLDISILGFLTLAAGDVVDIRADCTTSAGTVITVIDANLNCRSL